MRTYQLSRLAVLSILMLVIATGCGEIDAAQERVSGLFEDSNTLSERAEQTLDRLDTARASDLDLRLSDTITLQQLQDAGIPVGSHQIACDKPLDIVVVEGIFDRENLFTTGASLAGGSAESMAMRLVAEVYDPDTDMPLGMIGDSDGGQLGNLLDDSSFTADSTSTPLMLESGENSESGTLVPEAVCP